MSFRVIIEFGGAITGYRFADDPVIVPSWYLSNSYPLFIEIFRVSSDGARHSVMQLDPGIRWYVVKDDAPPSTITHDEEPAHDPNKVTTF